MVHLICFFSTINIPYKYVEINCFYRFAEILLNVKGWRNTIRKNRSSVSLEDIFQVKEIIPWC